MKTIQSPLYHYLHVFLSLSLNPNMSHQQGRLNGRGRREGKREKNKKNKRLPALLSARLGSIDPCAYVGDGEKRRNLCMRKFSPAPFAGYLLLPFFLSFCLRIHHHLRSPSSVDKNRNFRCREQKRGRETDSRFICHPSQPSTSFCFSPPS